MYTSRHDVLVSILVVTYMYMYMSYDRSRIHSEDVLVIATARDVLKKFVSKG
jgi:hypothetical protein